MKHIFLLTILFLLFGCHKEQPEMSEQIEGTWIQTFGTENIYNFSHGLCTQYTFTAGTLVYTNLYGYTCNENTMNLTDIEDRSEHVWTVTFPTDTTAEIETGAFFVLNLTRWP
jgi:hypothetical protein